MLQAIAACRRTDTVLADWGLEEGKAQGRAWFSSVRAMRLRFQGART